MKNVLQTIKPTGKTNSQYFNTKNLWAGIVMALVGMTIGINNAEAQATRVAVTSGSWSNSATWGGAGNVPANSGDYIIINPGVTLLVDNALYSCNSLTFKANVNSANSILEVNSGLTFAVNGDITVQNPSDKPTIQTATIKGNVSAGNLIINGDNQGNYGNGNFQKAKLLIESNGKLIIPGNIQFNGTSGNRKNGELELKPGGNLIVGGVFSTEGTIALDATSKVAFDKLIAQDIPALNYGDLELSGIGTKKLLGNITAKNVTSASPLNFNGFSLDIANNTFTLMPAGSFTGVTAAANIKLGTTGSIVAKSVGSSSVFLPIANATSFTPATISNSGVSQDFTVTLSNLVTKNGSSVTNNIVKRTWDIVPSGSGANATITLQWNESDEVIGQTGSRNFNRNLCGISHWDAALNTWETFGVTMAPATAGTVANSWKVSRSNITSFSPFAVGDNLSPLPVELVSFKAAKTENGTALTWETASEKNNKGYDVQASADGKNFETVAFVASKNGNANYSQRYEFLDKTSRSGLVYYRLKQTDFDGTVAYYAAKVVDLGKFAEGAVAYPNPFQNQFEVKLNGASTVEVTDLTGKVIFHNQVSDKGINALSIDMTNQPAGVYLLKATASGSHTITRIVKQ